MKIRGLNSQSTPQITKPCIKDKQAVWTAEVVLSVFTILIKNACAIKKKKRERELFVSFLKFVQKLQTRSSPFPLSRSVQEVPTQSTSFIWTQKNSQARTDIRHNILNTSQDYLSGFVSWKCCLSQLQGLH